MRTLRWLRTYKLLVGAAWRAEMQYRGNLLVNILGGLCYQGAGLAFIWAVLARFGNLGGWTLGEIAFLYGLRLAAHGLWIVPGHQLLFVDQVVVEGEYDRYLVRPAPPLLQLLTRRFRPIALGDLAGGLSLLAIAGSQAPINWSVPAVGFLVLAVVGGAMVEASVHLAASALVFRILKTMPLKQLIDGIFNDFGNYPMKVFGPAARFGLTFIFPLAFVAYLPSTALLNRTGELSVPSALAWLSPFIGFILLLLSYRFWSQQSRHFQSSGH
ncbi:ABC transporter permease [Streptomyces sp. NBC_01538]|jgi:ABC-2 type transport system permease protein|uniref:ABC transporter permease n=1 Tax=Streptomyces sp. NBC_01538 TaxID=2903897 RepID=UPI0038655982